MLTIHFYIIINTIEKFGNWITNLAENFFYGIIVRIKKWIWNLIKQLKR